MAHAIAIRRFLLLAALLVPPACCAQAATVAVRPECARFQGEWSGTWSQGFYGTQRIHVTQVSDQCVAMLAYSPTEARPQAPRPLQIRDGVIAFSCNGPAGACRMEVKGAELVFTFTDPSGFVNTGTFRRDR